MRDTYSCLLPQLLLVILMSSPAIPPHSCGGRLKQERERESTVSGVKSKMEGIRHSYARLGRARQRLRLLGRRTHRPNHRRGASPTESAMAATETAMAATETAMAATETAMAAPAA